MATTGTMLMDLVSQNAVIFVATVMLATLVAFIGYYLARVYLQSSSVIPIRSNSGEQDVNPDQSTVKSSFQSQPDTKHAKESEDKADPIDPVHYCEHIQGEIKKVKQGVTTRKICENLSPEQIAEERQRQQDQLAEIFKLMQEQQDKFGIGSMEEMQQQMRLYADVK